MGGKRCGWYRSRRRCVVTFAEHGLMYATLHYADYLIAVVYLSVHMVILFSRIVCAHPGYTSLELCACAGAALWYM